MSESKRGLVNGLYDRLVYADELPAIQELISSGRASVTDPSLLARRELLINEISGRLPELLDEVVSPIEGKAEQARAELQFMAGLLRKAREDAKSADLVRPLAEPAKLLRAIHAPDNPPPFPETGLRRPWLFTSARNDPSLLSELRAELSGADRVDILVSFITWSGVRKLLDVFKQVTALDANGNPKTRFRILTTTYIGATEARAVDALARLPGVELRISLDGRRTRLHAKAWLFHRDTGFGTAFVGSANLSESALIGGIEWTLKIAQAGDATLFAAAGAHFETLWNDVEFQPYNPDDAIQRKTLEAALRDQKGNGKSTDSGQDIVAIQTWFELRPKAYQAEMLNDLAAERRHGRNRNLIVAATGTGKTVVAAFDYARLAKEEGSPPRLLFVAHRVQILRQALSTFRQVLRDPAFGELMDGANEPRGYEHLFATINTVHSRHLVETVGADHWRVVIVDEAHHLPAQSFDKFIQQVKPHFLLGLTATPERTDGQSLNKYFDPRPDGSPAVSLRLWDALDQQLLAPFEYYATADDTDFTSVKWSRAEEAMQLDSLLSANDFRSRIVIDAIERYVSDLTSLKAIAFCVSVRHAETMAAWFNKSGLPAVSLTGVNSVPERESAIKALRAGKIKIICSCDLFNEGVDLPELNTLLLLRPTQSPVVFQQQLGRGLRLADGKACCLVLDFIGQYSEDFRFDILLRAISGQTREQLKRSVEQGFSLLPAGCHIQFDKLARDRVLSSLKASLNLNSVRLRREISAWVALQGGKPARLNEFLRDTGLELDDIYRGNRCWSAYMRDIGLPVPPSGPREEELQKRVQSVLHVNDSALLETWSTVLSTGKVDPQTEYRVQMLAYQLLNNNKELIAPCDFIHMLSQHPALRDELLELFALLEEQTTVLHQPLPDAPSCWPLALHARYERREIQTAVGHLSSRSRPLFFEGCLPLQNVKTELLFVTLDKSEGFSERVQYHDYAISPALFHWQTQNRAGVDNATGRRYIDSADNGWKFQLFVRENPDCAYFALGPVLLEQHEGDRPISITWRLKCEMPAEIFRKLSVIRG